MNLSSPAEVAKLLRRHNVVPKRRFGQNFLTDANVLNRIVEAGQLSDGGRVLEVGTGLGVLTGALAGKVGPTGKVVTFEVDRSLVPPLEETLRSFPQVELIVGDILGSDFAAIRSGQFCGATDVTVVANIPYNITTPLLTRVLENKEWIRNIVFLVQREVANRLIAKAGTSDYGALSVYAQFHAVVEIIAPVSRRVFVPAPDVESAIVRLRIRPEHLFPGIDEGLFFRIVRASFGQRRKSLLNALSGDPSLGWKRDQSAAALSAAAINPGRRGETLSLQEFAAIAAGSERCAVQALENSSTACS